MKLLSLLLVSMAGACLLCGCSTQRKETAEFSIELPLNWVQIKGALYDPKGALSPDGRIMHVSSEGFEVPQWLPKVSQTKYARVVVLHWKVQPTGFLIMQLVPFHEALMAMDSEGDLREKGMTDIAGQKVSWSIERSLIPVSGQQQLVSGTVQPGVQASGTGYNDQYMNVLNLNYVFQKAPGDFYTVSFQCKEGDFPVMRSMFEGLAKTFSLK